MDIDALRAAAHAQALDRHDAAVLAQISPLDSHPYARALAAATRDKNRALGDTLIAQERADVKINRFDVRRGSGIRSGSGATSIGSRCARGPLILLELCL
jgi:hypothetical protein